MNYRCKTDCSVYQGSFCICGYRGRKGQGGSWAAQGKCNASQIAELCIEQGEFTLNNNLLDVQMCSTGISRSPPLAMSPEHS